MPLGRARLESHGLFGQPQALWAYLALALSHRTLDNREMPLSEFLPKLRSGQDLTTDEAGAAIHDMLSSETSDEVTADFLIALADKGEAFTELAGAATAIRSQMRRVRTSRHPVLDTCGTGGDKSGTFNISTAAAIVTAAAGVAVAKHGNRSITSKSGSADVLTRLGVNIEADVNVIEKCLEDVGICFCFAPQLHPAVGRVAGIRKRLGRPTIFNWIGPLCNPADTRFQLLGVGRPSLRPAMADALRLLGSEHGAVVSGDDGLDEVTLATATNVSVVTPQEVADVRWEPGSFGVESSSLQPLVVDSAAASAAMIGSVLDGVAGPARDIVVINAAAALWAARADDDLAVCADRAREAIDDGSAKKTIAALARVSHS